MLENALPAIDHGASVATYARVDRLIMKTKLRARESPKSAPAQPPAQSRIIINAWSMDRSVVGDYGRDFAAAYWRTKGTTSSSAHLRCTANALMSKLKPTPPVLYIPWNDNYLIGTTDIRTGDLDRVPSRAGN